MKQIQKNKQQHSKHVPMRMCAVSREKLPKSELIRFVKTDDGIVLDDGGKLKGRGLNMKPDIEIVDLALKKKVFSRTFGKEPTQAELERIKEQILSRKNGRKIVRVTSDQLNKLKDGESE